MREGALNASVAILVQANGLDYFTFFLG